MKKLFYSLALMSLSITLFAAPALSRVHTFVQPDATTFQGVLMGDSSLHWIESDGKIIVLNPEDKFYYIAEIKNNKLVPTTQKAHSPSMRSASRTTSKENHIVSKDTREQLQKVIKQTRQGNFPR
jgi:hypothetical protein